MGLIKDILYNRSKFKHLKKVKGQAIFPYYHLVADEKKEHIKYLYPYKNIETFQSDIEILRSHYVPLAVNHIFENKVDTNTFLLTFDDGLKEIYTTIYPILKEKGLSALFFINPDFVDNKKMMYKHRLSVLLSHLERVNFTKDILDKIAQLCGFKFHDVLSFKAQFLAVDFSKEKEIDQVFDLLHIDEELYLKQEVPYITKEQIQEMIDHGFYFGGHTMSHRPFNRLSFEEQKKEVIDSIQWLKYNFNLPYSLFAFPFSDRGVSKKLLEELFKYDATLTIFGNSGIKKDVDTRIMQRFSVENPKKEIARVIVTENLYKYFNILIGKYKIKRR